MKEELIPIIIDALTSGEYKQAKGRLRKSNTFCCLGVISDLHRKMTGQGHWEGDIYVTASSNHQTHLALEVQEWAGLKDSAGYYTPQDASNTHCLINDNDGDKSFPEIAEIIFDYLT